jgi:UDP-N-acetylmuramyl pentapeptide phosphotransferase/UDP-N-acetylglucosamine-1-phosphate transferase
MNIEMKSNIENKMPSFFKTNPLLIVAAVLFMLAAIISFVLSFCVDGIDSIDEKIKAVCYFLAAIFEFIMAYIFYLKEYINALNKRLSVVELLSVAVAVGNKSENDDKTTYSLNVDKYMS